MIFIIFKLVIMLCHYNSILNNNSIIESTTPKLDKLDKPYYITYNNSHTTINYNFINVNFDIIKFLNLNDKNEFIIFDQPSDDLFKESKDVSKRIMHVLNFIIKLNQWNDYTDSGIDALNNIFNDHITQINEYNTKVDDNENVIYRMAFEYIIKEMTLETPFTDYIMLRDCCIYLLNFISRYIFANSKDYFASIQNELDKIPGRIYYLFRPNSTTATIDGVFLALIDLYDFMYSHFNKLKEYYFEYDGDPGVYTINILVKSLVRSLDISMCKFKFVKLLTSDINPAYLFYNVLYTSMNKSMRKNTLALIQVLDDPNSNIDCFDTNFISPLNIPESINIKCIIKWVKITILGKIFMARKYTLEESSTSIVGIFTSHLNSLSNDDFPTLVVSNSIISTNNNIHHSYWVINELMDDYFSISNLDVFSNNEAQIFSFLTDLIKMIIILERSNIRIETFNVFFLVYKKEKCWKFRIDRIDAFNYYKNTHVFINKGFFTDILKRFHDKLECGTINYNNLVKILNKIEGVHLNDKYVVLQELLLHLNEQRVI